MYAIVKRTRTGKESLLTRMYKTLIEAKNMADNLRKNIETSNMYYVVSINFQDGLTNEGKMKYLSTAETQIHDMMKPHDEGYYGNEPD